MPGRKRPHPVQLYLDDAEYIILMSRYRNSGKKNLSEFIRQAILYGFIYDVDYSELHEMNYQLAKIGNNINQIAHRVNATNRFYHDDVTSIKEMQERIWQLQKSILSNQRLSDLLHTSVTKIRRTGKS